jgi:tetratricopeptide (TPR) repeat protein
MRFGSAVLLLALAPACASRPTVLPRGYGAQVVTAPSAYEHYVRARIASERGEHDLAIAELRMASASAGSDPELRVALGEELLVAGLLPPAMAEATAATEAWPEDAPAWLLLGRVRVAHAEPWEAARAFERALALEPGHEGAYLMLAATYRQIGDTARAVATLGRLVEKLPTSAEGRFRYGRALAETQPALAARQLDRAVALDPDHIDARVALAEVLRRTGRAAEARETLRAAFDRSGADATVGERLYQVLLENGDREGAVELLRALDARWRPASVRLRLATFLLHLRRPDEALKIGRETVTASPTEHGARVLIARALAQLGRVSEAVAACREVPADAAAYIEARAFAAEALGRAGAPQDGLGIVNQALALWPNEPPLVAAAASLHERLGDLERARALLDGALAAAPSDETLLYARASLEERANQPDRAVAIMRRLLERDADSVTALNFIGYSYADRNVDLEASERMLRRAHSLRPDDAFVLDSLGWLHLRRGNLDEARAALERAGRLAPFEPEILFHLGELSLRRGEDSRARELFREALALEPPVPLRGRLEDRMRTLEAKASPP